MLGSRWTQKPPVGTLLDRSNSLTQGLYGFYALNEGTGRYINDATGNIALATSGGPTWETGTGGLGLGCPGTSGSIGAAATVPSQYQFTNALTLAVGFRRLGATIQYGNIFGLKPNSSNSSPYNTCNILYNNTTGQFVLYYSQGASQTNVVAGSVPTTSDSVASASVSSAGSSVYINGALSTSVPNAFTAAWTSTAQIQIGYQTGGSGETANSLFYWAAWWNRVLSATEHALIGSSINAIWQMMRPARNVMWSYKSASAGLGYRRGSSTMTPSDRRLTGRNIWEYYG
jgi:hypothetical protein